MAKQTARFVPFHAINEFMRVDYRQAVVQDVFFRLSEVSAERQAKLSSLVRKHVKVNGFRNSSQAPASMLVRPAITAFEKYPDFAAQTLQAWSDLHARLRKEVYDFLSASGWTLLPIDADRSVLPGFLSTWPKDTTFETIVNAMQTDNPDLDLNPDDLGLMSVWLSGRLPLEHEEDSDTLDAE